MDRHQVIQIRVSPEEKQLIEEAAQKLGSPASTYMREAVLSLAATDATEEPIPAEPTALGETVPQKAMELVRTKGLSYKTARAQVERS